VRRSDGQPHPTPTSKGALIARHFLPGYLLEFLRPGSAIANRDPLRETHEVNDLGGDISRTASLVDNVIDGSNATEGDGHKMALLQITVKCMICLGKWFSKLYAARTAVQIAGMVTGFPASFASLN
jgi:hypothetical protein